MGVALAGVWEVLLGVGDSSTVWEGVLDFLLVFGGVSPISDLGDRQGSVVWLSVPCPLACSGVWESSFKPVRSSRVFLLGVPDLLLLPRALALASTSCFGVSCRNLTFSTSLVGSLHVGVALLEVMEVLLGAGVLGTRLVLGVSVGSAFGVRQGLVSDFGAWAGSGVQKSSWMPVMSSTDCPLTLADLPLARLGGCFSDLALSVSSAGSVC